MVHAYGNDTLGTGKAITGTTTAFVALGLGLGIAGFAAALFVDNVQGGGAESTAAGGLLSASIAIIPFIATPLLAVVAGLWAGTVTRHAGRATLAALVGTLLGMILMVALIAAGIALGTLVGSTPDFSTATNALGVDAGALTDLGFFASVTGITYVVVQLVIAAVTAAVVGALMPTAHDVDRDERPVARSVRG